MAVEQNKRAPVLDLSRPGAVTIEIDVAEAAEVLMSICAVADQGDHDTFDLGAEWLQARLESVPDELREQVLELRLGDMKVAAHLLGIVYETPGPRTFAAFMERLEAIDPVELKLHLFGHYDTTSGHIPHDIVESAARGDEAAIDQVLEALAEWSDKHELYRGDPADGRPRAEDTDRRPAPTLVRAGLRSVRAGVARRRQSGTRRPSTSSRRVTRRSSSSSRRRAATSTAHRRRFGGSSSSRAGSCAPG